MNYPYEHGPNIESQPSPSRATAVIAAILAAITGLLTSATTIVSVVVVADVASDERSSNSDLPDLGPIVAGLFVVIGIAAGILTLLYLPGALLLFRRRTAGRVLVVVASTLGSTLAVVAVVMDVNVGTLAAVLLCGATLVLAALPDTGRWIAAGKQSPRQTASPSWTD